METDTVERFENHTNNTKEISYLNWKEWYLHM